MKSPLLLSLLVLSLAPAALRAADTKPAEKSETAVRHALRGVIVSVNAELSTFSVKHEEIPGVMRAMTMPFKVDAATFKAFKTGDAITGQMSRQGRNWVLEDVKPAAKPAK